MPSATATLFLNLTAIRALARGNNGNTILSSPVGSVPSNTLGVSGDFFIDTNNALYYDLYGPKTTTWPGSPVRLVTQTYVNAISTTNSVLLELLSFNNTTGFGHLSTLIIEQPLLSSLSSFPPLGIIKSNYTNQPVLSLCSFNAEIFNVDQTGLVEANTITISDTLSVMNLGGGVNLINGTTVIGNELFATGGSLAIGSNNTINGSYAFAGGLDVEVAGDFSMCFGKESQSDGSYSISLGVGAKADHDRSFVWASSGQTDFRAVKTTNEGQFIAYGDNNAYIGRKVGVNCFTSNGDGADSILSAYTTLPATLTVNGTISSSGIITTGASTVNGTISSSGVLTANGISSNSNLTVNGTISSSRHISLSSINIPAISGAGVPTTSDVPQDHFVMWYDTTSTTLCATYNIAGVIKAVPFLTV